jgi:uncharacterized protein (TIGR03435 family)
MLPRVAFCSSVVAVTFSCVLFSAQNDTRAEAFEVASIRQNASGERAMTYHMPAGSQLLVTNMPVFEIIKLAYQLQSYQLVDGPGWITAERYDIVAKPPEGIQVTPRTFPLMLRRLLAERFGLTVRGESRPMSVYRLTRLRDDGKLGEKIQQSDLDCEPAARGRVNGAAQQAVERPPNRFGTPPCIIAINRGRLGISGLPLSTFVTWLAPMVNRFIVDDSRLTGAWDIDLTYTRPGADPSSASDPPSIFTAIQEQLGLKLESGIAPVDVIVITAISRPTQD